MTFLDKAKDLAAKVGDKANQVAGDLADKAGPLAEKAGPLAEKAGTFATKGVSVAASSVDKATCGKYHDKITNISGKVGDKLSEVLNRDSKPGDPKPTDQTHGGGQSASPFGTGPTGGAPAPGPKPGPGPSAPKPSTDPQDPAVP